MFNKNDPKVLPLKNGVKPSCVVLPSQGQGLALDFLCQRLPAVSRSDWLQRMAAHEVVDERGRPVTPETPFLTGLRIYYYRQTAHEPPMPFRAQVLYQDAHLVVADKPHFLPVTPGGSYIQHTLLVQLKNQLVSEGELVLETLVVEGNSEQVLVPGDRYAQMGNIYFIPSAEALKNWLIKCGFVDVRIADVSVTTLEEQRRTDWMTSESLAEFLDPNDPTKTIEGYPAPRRALLIARKP